MSPESKGVSIPVAIASVVVTLVVVGVLGVFVGNKFFWVPAETRNIQQVRFDATKEAYQKNPKDPNARLTYALVLHAQKKDAEAGKIFLALVKEFPKQNDMLTNYAIFLADTGKSAEAEKNFQKVLSRAPYFGMANVQYGMLLRNDGKYSEAIKKFDNALRMEPTAADILLEKAKVYAAMKDKEKAKEYANKALSFYPNYEDAKKLLKELE